MPVHKFLSHDAPMWLQNQTIPAHKLNCISAGTISWPSLDGMGVVVYLTRHLPHFAFIPQLLPRGW